MADLGRCSRGPHFLAVDLHLWIDLGLEICSEHLGIGPDHLGIGFGHPEIDLARPETDHLEICSGCLGTGPDCPETGVEVFELAKIAIDLAHLDLGRPGSWMDHLGSENLDHLDRPGLESLGHLDHPAMVRIDLSQIAWARYWPSDWMSGQLWSRLQKETR